MELKFTVKHAGRHIAVPLQLNLSGIEMLFHTISNLVRDLLQLNLSGIEISAKNPAGRIVNDLQLNLSGIEISCK